MFTIYWKHNDSDKCGNGKPDSNYNILLSWTDSLNKKYPEIKHWIKQN